MRRILSIAGLLALACGSVSDKQACSVSTDCPAGQYCARAEGEARCWADATAPVVQTVTATCATPTCLRDGVLHVEATVTDDAEVLDASVTLDLAGAPVAMTASQGKWVADVPLRTFPFPAYARDVTATVTARDGARTTSAPKSAAAVGVTRLRWMYDAGAPITSPAVMADGTAVVGVSSATDQALAVARSGAKSWSHTVGGTAFVTATPSIGNQAIWVGSEDSWLHAIALDGTSLLSSVGVNIGSGVKGSVAVTPGATDWAFAASDAGFVGAAASTAGVYAVAAQTNGFAAGPVVGLDGRAYAANTAGFLRAYRLTTSPAVTMTEVWGVSVGVEVAAPPAVDSTGAVWCPAVEKLTKTAPADSTGDAMLIATLQARISDSPVILAGGDVVVGDQTGGLHRFAPGGAPVWTSPPNLGAPVRAPLILADGDAMLVVPAGGRLFAMDGAGSEVWSTTLDTGKVLRAPNIYTPPGQTSNVMSTAYVASSSGKLFAVVVDGQLDSAAPWPKAFHDPRNTNRAGPQP